MATAELQISDPIEEIPNEIECPRCYGGMTLCSDFDLMFYSCEDCDFILHTVDKE